MDANSYLITIKITDEHAQALAHFLRSTYWPEIKAKSINEIEASKMEAALGMISKSLLEAGVPRPFCEL